MSMQPEVAMVILLDSEGEGRRWALDRERLEIGRDPSCDILLPDRVVSRHHAIIERCEEGYVLRDNGSKNGTFVNGEPVNDGHLLRDGDEIQIALRFRLIFVAAGATAPLSPPPTEAGSGGLRLDDTRRTVELRGKVLDPPLSAAQYRLLSLLMQANGAVVDRDQIVRSVWPDVESAGVTEQAIDALVRRLRERLAELEPNHQYIITVRGHGFRFENPA